jgi:hypothetical protein
MDQRVWFNIFFSLLCFQTDRHGSKIYVVENRWTSFSGFETTYVVENKQHYVASIQFLAGIEIEKRKGGDRRPVPPFPFFDLTFRIAILRGLSSTFVRFISGMFCWG